MLGIIPAAEFVKEFSKADIHSGNWQLPSDFHTKWYSPFYKLDFSSLFTMGGAFYFNEPCRKTLSELPYLKDLCCPKQHFIQTRGEYIDYNGLSVKLNFLAHVLAMNYLYEVVIVEESDEYDLCLENPFGILGIKVILNVTRVSGGTVKGGIYNASPMSESMYYRVACRIYRVKR